MPDVTTLDNLYLIVGFLAPGLIVLFVRSQFVTGRIAPNLGLVPYVVVSVVYYALAYPFVDAVVSIHEPGFWKVLGWFSLIFVGTCGPWALAGGEHRERPVPQSPATVRSQSGSRHTDRMGVEVPSHAPQWVLVTLKNGTRFAGYCGRNPSMSLTQPNVTCTLSRYTIWIAMTNGSMSGRRRF